METNQQDPIQISSSKEAPISFIQKNMVGVIVFFIFIFYDFLRSGNILSIIIDIPIGLFIATILQRAFNGLKKLFEK
jgi:hypothetical protein